MIISLVPTMTIEGISHDNFVYSEADEINIYSITTTNFQKGMAITLKWLVEGEYIDTLPEGISYVYDEEEQELIIVTTSSANAGVIFIIINVLIVSGEIVYEYFIKKTE